MSAPTNPPATEPTDVTPSVQSLIDLATDPLLLVGRDGVVLRASRAFDQVVGLRRSDVVGRRLADLADTPAPELTAYLRRCSGSLQPIPGALLFRGPDGEQHRFRAAGAATLTDEERPGPILIRLRPHRNAVAEFSLLNDRVRRLSQEILRRRAIEEELRRSEERHRLAVDAAGIGTWDLDPESGQVECSDRCSELLNLPPGLPMAYDALLAGIHDEDRERTHLAIRAALASEGSNAFAVEYRVANAQGGPERWIAHRGEALFEGGRAVRVIGVVLDITEQRQAAEHQRLLINELNHRVKNTLATVQSIAEQTLRHTASLDGFKRSFEARLLALSQTHNLLTQAKWRGTSLHGVLAAEAAPFQDPGGSRLRAAGPHVHLSPKAAVAFGLTFHELVTNAVKYGALSVPEGYVQVSWSLDRTKEVPGFLMRWEERDGPTVEPQARRGFGTRLIERGLTYDLGGTVELHFLPTGVECVLDIPLSVLEQSDYG
jgi:two-component sensor histidine kinase